MNRKPTEFFYRHRPRRKYFRAVACLLLFYPPLLLAASPCFYDGVSQTTLTQIIRQVSENYQVAVISDKSIGAQDYLAQPLGDCSLEEFLTLATLHSHWHYRHNPAGVVLYYRPQENPVRKKSSPDEEIIVTAVPFIHDAALASRYSSNTLIEQTDLQRGQLSGNNDLTASIGQMSAIAFSQEAGMDRNISIRGLSPDYSRVLVNGMPMLATSTSIDARGSVNNSRSFDFNVLPQGLFTQVQVTKSSTARSNEGSIGGTVDLRTPMPFDTAQNGTGEQQWLTIQGENNVRNDSDGVTLAGGFQGVRDDGNLGWLMGFSYRNRSTEEKGFSTVRWRAADWGEQAQLTAEQQAQLASGTLFSPRHNRYDIINRQQEIYGISTALQWRNDIWGDVDLTFFGARNRQDVHEYHISSSGLKYADLSDVQVNDFTSDSSGMIYGDFSGVNIRSEHNHEIDETTLGQMKLDWHVYLAPAWRLNSSLGYQSSVFTSPVHDKVSFMAYDQDFSFDLRKNNRIAVNTYGFDITDPESWELYSVNMQEDDVTNQYRVGSLELAFDNGGNVKHFAGLQFQGFFNDREEAEYSNDDVSGAVGTLYQLTPDNFSSGFGLSGLPTNWVVGSQDIITSLGLSDADLIRDPLQQRKLNEYTWSGWWQTAFELWQLPWPVRGDVGLRYSATRQFVRGSWQISDESETVQTSLAYRDWLPSLHLVAHAHDNLLLRFAYSRDLSRPSIDDLTSPLLLYSSAQLVAGGNTGLQPSRAHSFDLATEWYGTHDQFVSLGLFYKRIDSLIVDEVEDVTLDQLPYYNALWDASSDSDTVYAYSRPVNGPGTDISGFELSAKLPFSFLPSPFNHLGFSGAYALSRGVVRYPLDDGYKTLPPPGLSRHVVNGELWYQDSRFSAGVTVRARSRYLTQVPGNNDNDSEGVNASVIFGAYVSWMFDPQLHISLDARNLTNEAFDMYVDSSNRVYSYSTTGTEVFVSLDWRFGN